MLIAAAAISLVGCKEDIPESIAETSHKVKIVADREFTKTTYNIDEPTNAVIYSWSTGDEEIWTLSEETPSPAKFFVFENGEPATGICAYLDNDLMTIEADFAGEPVSGATYSGYFNSKVASEQLFYEDEDDGTLVYDQDSDVMVAAETTAAEDGTIQFCFKRLVSFAQLNLLNIEGEEVTEVKLISNNSNFAGDFNFEDQSFVNLEQGITITTESPIESDVTGSGATVVAVLLPTETQGFSITVATADATGAPHTYTKDITKTISFTRGNVKGLNINFEGCEVVSEPVYEKVTSELADWSGEYLLVYESSATAGLCWTGVDAGKCHADGTINDGVIEAKPDGAAILTIAPIDGGYSIQINGGKYIGKSVNSNGIDFSDEAQVNTIVYGDNSVVVKGAGGCTLRYNKTAGDSNERFRYYKSGQEPVQLYKYTGASKQNQTLSFPQESYEVILGETFTAPTVTGAQTTVTYSSSDDEVATVDATSGAVQILSAGEVTITATACSDDTYHEGSASYTISIIDPDDVLTTVDAIYEASEEAGNYMVTFDDWVVSGVKGDNVYVTDGTKGFIIFKSGHGFMAGDILSGTVNSCALTRYNGAAEFTNISSSSVGLTVTKGGSVIPATISISELSGVNTGAVITFDDLTYNGTVFTDGTNDIKPYNTFITLPSLKSGAHYNVTGVYIQYGTTKEIAPRTAEDISEIAATQYDVIIASGILNGSVSANPTKAAAGVEVTLTATPATGYGLDAWIVKDAGNNAITVTNNKFTMPASNVTVSATFKDVSSESGTVVFDFSSTDALAKLGITAPNASAGTTLESCSVSPITISNTENGSTNTRVWNSNGSYDLRVYSGAKLTFNSTSNVITKIQFEGSTAFGEVSDGVWTGSSSTVILNGTGTSKITKITVTYGNPPVPSYLNASADKTNVSAAGETVTITVDTNVEGWTVASDNAAFTVGAKSGNTVPVTVSENTSTTDGRTANITVSATGVDAVVINLTQAKKTAPSTLTAGKSYSWQLASASKFSAWDTKTTVNNVSWTPIKTSCNGSPTVGNFDSARGQQFGAASTNQMKTLTIKGENYATYCNDDNAKGITNLKIALCAKSGNTITPTAKVGDVTLVAKTESATISGSTAEAVVTFEFTSETPLDGAIEFTVNVSSAGAIYVKSISIND